ncbi:hypothetical protein DJ534_09230 [Enterobacter hormaechei]|nr:hypothetical protein DN066_06500 [Enterobacter hormaechei subsp. xiangfangensis]MCZ9610723.1 hypothetical protein [Enterobacter hormaechei]RTN31032.1 hypothetical protein EKO01_00015 [Enterobacter hormaechei]TYF85221.1 hypothetical protein DJ534_09230 [Enterobacter hormaechei]TYG11622.1 hypothetical protein DJ543_09240 [Enterobacter hormaechei]
MVDEVVEFVRDFDFLREGEGAKRAAMMLIWKGFCIFLIFKLIVGSGIFRASLGSGGRYRLVVRFRK